MPSIANAYSQKKVLIKQQLATFSQVTEKEDIFYELCFCLLTPQTQGKRCWERVKQLRRHDFKHKEVDPHPFIKELRFHNHKRDYLLAAKRSFPLVLEQLQTLQEPQALREWLVQHVQGYGYKEASHFLRNIGYRNLAILDRHVLRNLQRYQVIEVLPKTLTEKRYLEIEQRFLAFAQHVGIPMDALDLLFWSEETGEVFK